MSDTQWALALLGLFVIVSFTVPVWVPELANLITRFRNWVDRKHDSE